MSHIILKVDEDGFPWTEAGRRRRQLMKMSKDQLVAEAESLDEALTKERMVLRISQAMNRSLQGVAKVPAFCAPSFVSRLKVWWSWRPWAVAH